MKFDPPVLGGVVSLLIYIPIIIFVFPLFHIDLWIKVIMGFFLGFFTSLILIRIFKWIEKIKSKIKENH